LDSPGIELYQALRERYGTGSVGEVANGYPAVAVRFRALGRKFPDPRAITRYGKSVANGVRSARRNIADVLGLCPQSYVLLGGYSQGAQVTRAVLAELGNRERKRVAAIVLFGDPYFDPHEKDVTRFPGGERERRGILLRRPGAKAAPIDPVYKGRVFSWCHPADIICEGLRGARSGQHGNYDRDVAATLREIAIPLARLGVKPAVRVHRYAVAGTCTVGVCALAEWSGAGTSFRRVGAVYEGQQVEVACQTFGEPVTGANGGTSAIWDQLSNGAFIPDYYVSTPGVGAPSPSISPC
jgi:hypothetical protein